MATKIRASNLHTDVTTLIQSLGGGADLYAANESSPSAQPSATGANAIAIGEKAISSGDSSIALGWSRADADDSFAIIGRNNTTSYGALGGFGTLAIGYNAKASTSRAFAIGNFCFSSGIDSIALGKNSNASAEASVAIGNGATANITNQVAIGSTAHPVKISGAYTLPTADGTASGQVMTTNGSGVVSWATASGGGADLYATNESSPSAQPSATGTNSIAIGDSAISTNTNSFAGPLSRAGGTNSFAMGIGNNQTGYGTVGNAHGIAMGQYARAQGNHDIAIGRSATASGENDSIAIGRLTTASTGYAVAIGYSNSASGNYSLAMGYDTTASANNATAIGSASNYTSKSNASGQGSVAIGGGTATATDSMALGDSRASGTNSFAVQITNNTSSYGASGANSIAIGSLAKASVADGIAIGKDTLVDTYDGIALGRNARAGNNAISIGQTGLGGGQSYALGQGSISIGQNNLAQQTASVVLGIHGHSNTVGKYVYSSGWLGGQGNAQTGTFVLIASTTDATAKSMSTGSGSASSNNQILLPNNSAYTFSGTIVAREKASEGTDVGSWEVKGIIRREANAGTTVLVNSVINELNAPTGWAVALSADTTNGALAITVTGVASTNIRWVATINTSEVIYA